MNVIVLIFDVPLMRLACAGDYPAKSFLTLTLRPPAPTLGGLEDFPLDPIDEQLPRSRAAIEQLERALQRLETVVSRSHHRDLFVEQELKSARSLEQELQTARADYARLDETSRLVEERLDVTINRLRSVLEE